MTDKLYLDANPHGGKTTQERWAWEDCEPQFDECYHCGEVCDLDEVFRNNDRCVYCDEEWKRRGGQR